MFALSVFLEVSPEHIEDFKQAALRHAANSKNNESGCLAFEVFQAPDNPARFFFYECYTDRKAVEEVHNKADYFARFGQTTGAWIVSKERREWQSPDAG